MYCMRTGSSCGTTDASCGTEVLVDTAGVDGVEGNSNLPAILGMQEIGKHHQIELQVLVALTRPSCR